MPEFFVKFMLNVFDLINYYPLIRYTPNIFVNFEKLINLIMFQVARKKYTTKTS